MSKRRRLWDEDAFEFSGKSTSQHEYPAESYKQDIDASETAKATEFLDEAHEALSKLFNKTTKRARQIRGMRRNDGW